MRTVALDLLRAGAGRRALAVAAATAVASGVLLGAACITMLWFDDSGWLTGGLAGLGMDPSGVNSIVADPSTRPGALFGAVLLVLPPLLLLDQAVRLGTVSRSRRDAALQVAGATRSEVRRLAALEVGVPSLVGGVLGIAVFLLLRWPLSASGFLTPDAFPTWWLTLAVVVLVALAGVVVGARSGSHDSLAVTRHAESQGQLGWWGPACLVAGGAVYVYTATHSFDDITDVTIYVALVLLVVGLIGSAPWVAFGMARRAERRASTAAQLLAARRVLAQPGAAGRAAAGIGAIGLTLGAASAFISDVVTMGSWGSGDGYDPGAVATVIAALLALAVAIGSLVVHATESLWESRRELSYLVATGTPIDVLDEALLRQVRLVAVPLGLAGAVLGGVGYGAYAGQLDVGQLITAAGIVLTALAVLLASWVAVLLVRPIARKATSPTHLRTE